MSIESTIQRVAMINSALANPALLVQGSSATAETGGTAAPSSSTDETASTPSFADALEQASLVKTDSEGSTTEAETSALVAALEQNGLSAADGESRVSPESLDTSLGASSDSASGATSLGSAYDLPTSGAYGVPSSASTYALQSTGLASGADPTSGTDLASAADSLAGASGTTAASTTSADSIGQRIVAIAESQAGQTEQPPGSNESPTISMYRGATTGSIPGAPWCAYFASWVAKQAGEPLGSEGQGLGAVSEVWSWAQSTGRAIENGPGVVPKPGDLIVFGDEHVGIVRSVLPNGEIETIEGNYENKVALNARSSTEATGYVEMS